MEEKHTSSKSGDTYILIKLMFCSFVFIMFEAEASYTVCVTGNVIMNGQIIGQTTICYIRETAEEGPADDGSGEGPAPGPGDGGLPVIVIKEDIGRQYMPTNQRTVGCFSPLHLRRAAAQAAFAKWKLTHPNMSIRNRTLPDYRNYRIALNDGAQIFKWANSFYSSAFFLKVSGCQ